MGPAVVVLQIERKIASSSKREQAVNTAGKRHLRIVVMSAGPVASPGLVQGRLAQHGILVTLE